MENKSIKDEIKKTYEKFNTIFLKETGRHLQEFKISEIRDQFKAWIKNNSQMFSDLYDAEDSFLYIYHFPLKHALTQRIGHTLKRIG